MQRGGRPSARDDGVVGLLPGTAGDTGGEEGRLELPLVLGAPHLF